MKALQHFDRTLGAEHRRKTEAEIEAGIAEAPKVRKHAGGRPRRSSLQSEAPKPDRNGKVTVEFSCSPKFLAAAALTAAREGITTEAVMERWMTTLAFADVPENPAPREVMFTMHLAVGEDAFPPAIARAMVSMTTRRHGSED